MERTLFDIKNIHKGYLNKHFYHKCPDNPKYYKTIFVGWDAFNQHPLKAHFLSPLSVGLVGCGVGEIALLVRVLRRFNQSTNPANKNMDFLYNEVVGAGFSGVIFL